MGPPVDGEKGGGDFVELASARDGVAVEDCHGRTDKTLAISDEFAIAVEVDALVEQAEAREEQELISVQAECEAHAAFLEQLDDLDDVFA